jgi:hypothetical protein
MEKIRIIKDTPFDKVGTELTIHDFRSKYSYICTKNTTDEELICYLKHEYYNIFSLWFEVIETSELPLCFVHEDIWYVKEMDGMYSGYISPSGKEHMYRELDTSVVVRRITMRDAQDLISTSKYKNMVPVYTNFVNRQMN